MNGTESRCVSLSEQTSSEQIIENLLPIGGMISYLSGFCFTGFQVPDNLPLGTCIFWIKAFHYISDVTEFHMAEKVSLHRDENSHDRHFATHGTHRMMASTEIRHIQRFPVIYYEIPVSLPSFIGFDIWNCSISVCIYLSSSRQAPDFVASL